MIDLTKPVAVITVPAGFVAADFLVNNTMTAKVYPTLSEAAKVVSALAKAGVKNLRVRRFHNGEVTNLKD